MSLGVYLNNWMNIKWLSANNWKGQKGQDKGFCDFDTVEHGLRAGRIILEKYLEEGYDTIDHVVRHFSATDQDVYVKNVCEWTNMPSDFILTVHDIPNLIKAICRQETDTFPTDEQMKEVMADG